MFLKHICIFNKLSSKHNSYYRNLNSSTQSPIICLAYMHKIVLIKFGDKCMHFKFYYSVMHCLLLCSYNAYQHFLSSLLANYTANVSKIGSTDLKTKAALTFQNITKFFRNNLLNFTSIQ